MNKEETEALEKIASKRNMTVEEVTKYREYSSKSLNDEEWIEYLRLCEKAFKNTSKYLYLYEHEIREINKYIDKLEKENNQLKEQRQELRSWLEQLIEYYDDSDVWRIERQCMKDVLSKLNELEGKNE